MQSSSQNIAVEATELFKEKEELEIELAIKKKCKEQLLVQKSFMRDKELSLQRIDEVQASINDIEKRIAQLKLNVEKQNAKKEKLEEDIAKKQKELKENNRYLQASKMKCSLLQTKMNTERMEFDLKLRQQLQSSEKIQAELNVGLI